MDQEKRDSSNSRVRHDLIGTLTRFLSHSMVSEHTAGQITDAFVEAMNEPGCLLTPIELVEHSLRKYGKYAGSSRTARRAPDCASAARLIYPRLTTID
jgi:hypothetical protein